MMGDIGSNVSSVSSVNSDIDELRCELESLQKDQLVSRCENMALIANSMRETISSKEAVIAKQEKDIYDLNSKIRMASFTATDIAEMMDIMVLNTYGLNDVLFLISKATEASLEKRDDREDTIYHLIVLAISVFSIFFIIMICMLAYQAVA